MRAFPLTALTLSLFLATHTAAFADLDRYPGGDFKVSARDMIPTPGASRNSGEWYSEQYSFSFVLDGESNTYLAMVISNLGPGDGKLKFKWEIAVGDMDTVTLTRSFSRSDWSYDKKRFDIRIGSGEAIHWQGKPGKIEVDIALDGWKVHYEVRNVVPAWKPGSGRLDLGRGGYYAFQILAPMARAKITGTRPDGTAFEMKGWAYGDHSVTNTSSDKIARRWARFRAFSGKYAIHFVELFPPSFVSSRSIGFLMVARRGKGVIFQSLDAHGTYENFEVDTAHRNRYKVPHKAKFDARDGDRRLRLVTKVKRKVWREDYLQSLGSIARMIVAKFAQPVGYGFDSAAKGILESPGGGRQILSGTGRYIVTHVSK